MLDEARILKRAMAPMNEHLNIFITSPVEPEHVERIRSIGGNAVTVIYEPDLLPPTRYVADHKGVEGFVRTDNQEERWRAHLASAHILWDFPAVIRDSTDNNLIPNLRWVQTTSSGVGQLVENLGLQDPDILVTTARGIHAQPLAEFTLLTLLMHFKGLQHLEQEQRQHAWARYCGDGLAGKTIAVIGAGGVGRRVLATAGAFGMRTVALNRAGSSKTAVDLGIDAVFTHDQQYAMLNEADALVLCLPHTPESEGMIDGAALAALKPGGVLVNVARGAVVDEVALAAALQSGQIGFAALDVFAVEPLPSDSPLWDMSNVLISPHSASTVAAENTRITDIFCHNLQCFVDDRFCDMQNMLDKGRMY